MSQRLLLIRHCESSGPSPEAPLTSRGFEDAVRLADRLLGLRVDALYSSPYLRAQQTLEPFAKASKLSIKLDERLREHSLGAPPVEDWLDHTRRAFADLDYKTERGDKLRDSQTRALAAIGQIISRDHQFPAVASHGVLISSILKYINPDFGFEDWRSLRNPDLIEVCVNTGRAVAWMKIGNPT